ncbi:MAG: nickel-dependent hydrogenase large subunit [Micromonosporaceae bacterium]
MTHRHERTLSVSALSRVEGEGAMYVRARGGAVEQVRLEIYEPPRFFEAYGVTEAPRGVLYHRYDLEADGTVRTARIVPPTAQNQAAIEDNLRGFVADRLELDDDQLTHACEQLIRSYDPCISCSTHFLDLRVDRA